MPKLGPTHRSLPPRGVVWGALLLATSACGGSDDGPGRSGDPNSNGNQGPCAANNGGCDPLVSCTNASGVAQCGACPAGFVDVNDDGSECDGRPSAADDTAVTGENTAVRIDVQANDSFGADGAGALELVSASIAGNVTLDDNGTPEDASDDAFVYTPETDFSGTGSFVYRIVDGAGESAEATVALEVTASLRIAIDFPTSGAALGGAERFPVRGRLTDPGDGVVRSDEVTAVEVNGVAALLNDADPSVWRAEVPLEPRLAQGLEATVVSTTGRRSVSLSVSNAPILIEPGAVVMSADASTVYVIDTFDFREALISVNLRTEEWTVVSDEQRGTGPPLGSPVSLALSADETTAYILDSDGSPALLSVNLATGDRTVVSDDGTGGDPMFVDPGSVAVSEDETTAYVVDSGLNAIVSVDLATGDRTVVSDAAMGGDPQFMRPRSLVLSADETTAYVVDAGLEALLSVNLVTGDRTVLADNDTPNGGRRFNSPGVVAVNVDETTAYILNRNSRELLSLDLATGARTLVSRFLSPVSVALSADETTAYVADSELGIFAVDLDNGEQTSVSSGAPGGGPQLSNPRVLALSAEGTTAYVLDAVSNAPLLSVDLVSGVRNVISDRETGSGPQFQFPRSMALTADETTAYVVDSTLDALLSVNLATGERRVVSDDDTGGETQFDDPQSIALTRDDTTAYVVDLGLAALLSVNLATGDRTVVSDTATGGEPEFFRPRSIALNASETLAYVGDGNSQNTGSLLAVNLVTGARTVIFEGANGGPPSPNPPQSVALSVDETTVYVIESTSFPELFSVNLASGALMSVSDRDRGGGPQLFNPWSLVLSPDETTAYVVDSTYNALVSVDLATGSRAIISR
ncbi:MAG: cadherin-like domain-containing protein [Myxococcota bacterium]